MKVQSTHTAALVLPNRQTVPAGGTVEVPSEDWDKAKKHPVVKSWLDDGLLKAGKEDAKSASTDTGLKAVHRGGGSFSVMKGDEELVEGLKKADADAFNALSDEDKAAFVESTKKA